MSQGQYLGQFTKTDDMLSIFCFCLQHTWTSAILGHPPPAGSTFTFGTICIIIIEKEEFR